MITNILASVRKFRILTVDPKISSFYFSSVMFYKKIKPYQVYTLILFLVTYLLNQLDRYMLAITVQPMAQEIHFGDKGCLTNSSFTKSQLGDVKCNGTTQDA